MFVRDDGMRDEILKLVSVFAKATPDRQDDGSNGKRVYRGCRYVGLPGSWSAAGLFSIVCMC